MSYAQPRPFAPHISPATANSTPIRAVFAAKSQTLSSFNSHKTSSITDHLSDKFSLPFDAVTWALDAEDDFLPDPRRDRTHDAGASVFTYRGITNLGCLLVLGAGIIALFAGYPLVSYFSHRPLSNQGGFNLGGINATGQVPSMSGNWGLIDRDTPESAYTIQSYNDPSTQLQLVFSDEFNTDGRSFYPGDDPYWEAVDLRYWQTNNMEWYDPAAVTTKNGALQITLSAKETHNLHFQGGMLSSWNKFCFTGGLIQASVMLPGSTLVPGLWPSVWTMGNLGRAGYGASLEGMWPYTYDACDVGTAPNQTFNGLPEAATKNGDPANGGALSYLPGQRLSRCTCPGESHPGPIHPDGTFVGRAAPEIDVFEAQVSKTGGVVSQSAQWAPFNAGYEWFNTSANLVIPDPSTTKLNEYVGGVFQQATSGLSLIDQNCYELSGRCFSVYGFEYKPGFDDAYISWISNSKLSWTIKGPGLAEDTRVEISARPIPNEPMYIIIDLGMSDNFGDVDLEHLTFPAVMSVDWIRVYQRPDAINIGCSPADFPTADYINQYREAYTNPNLTTWTGDYRQPVPKNRFLGRC